MKTVKPIVFAVKPILLLFVVFMILWIMSSGGYFQQREQSTTGSKRVENFPGDGFEEVAGGLVGVAGELREQEEAVAEEMGEGLIAKHFSEHSRALIEAIGSGRAVEVDLGEKGSVAYQFWPRAVTTEDFQFSSGTDKSSALPAEFVAYEGRSIGAGAGDGTPASLAIVNDAVSLLFQFGGKEFLVEQDDSGVLIALQVPEFTDNQLTHAGSCNGSCSHDDVMAVTSVEGYNPKAVASFPIHLNFEAMDGTPRTADASVDHSHYRLGRRYDASLRDMVILWVSSKAETGPTSGLNGTAASYLALAGRVADVYERQLGIRYLLQELILLPSDSNEPDVANPALGSDDLKRLSAWLDSYRPQNVYHWGHATAWTHVAGETGGTVGIAYLDSYGNGHFSVSAQERAFGWRVHAHELGHNVGASHSVGGIMNPTLSGNSEDFYTQSMNGPYTAAKDISNYMKNDPLALGELYGPAALRDAEELPFANDDGISALGGNQVALLPLENDDRAVPFGVTNTIRLVEVGSVFPLAAGSVSISGDEVLFLPAPGYTGLAYFTYTIAGDQGNEGLGWLHSADVTVTIDSSLPPLLSPGLTTRPDVITSGLNVPVRVNPLLNDEATGRLWIDDVEVRAGPYQGSNPAWEDRAFKLVSANVVQGSGSIALETRPMIRNGVPVESNSGYIVYTPGANEGNLVRITYTVEDANGLRATDMIDIQRAAEVSIVGDGDDLVSSLGNPLKVTIQRNQVAPVGAPELVSYQVTGDAVLAGAGSDLAIGGNTDFDPMTGRGTVVIPENEVKVDLYMVPAPMPIVSPDRFCAIRLTESSSLPISAVSTVNFRVAVLSDVFVDNLQDAGRSGNWGVLQSRGDGIRWQLRNGPNPNPGTGANGGFPEATGTYLDVSVNGAYVPSSATVISRFFNFSNLTEGTLTFAYNMWGSDVGSLRLNIESQGVLHQNVRVFNGQQSADGDDWKVATVNLAGYLGSNFRLRFVYDSPTGPQGDIGLDNIIIRGTEARPGTALVVEAPLPDKAVAIGAPLYMAPAVAGFPSPEYQWYRNGAMVAGADRPAFYDPSFSTDDVGTYTAEVSSGNQVVSLTSFVVVAAAAEPGYAEWITTNGAGLGAADQLGSADPDGDGLSNFVEYAYGSDPLSGVSAGFHVPRVGEVPGGGGSSLVFEYRRRDGGAYEAGDVYVAQGVEYLVEASGDLAPGGWTSVGPAANLEVVPVQGGVETVRVQLLNNSQTRNFMRLRLRERP